MKMIDIHCHLLPNIDDGSASFEESMKMIENAKLNGITDIIITPHYMYGKKYNANNQVKQKLFSKLKSSENINLYLGNEVYYNENLLDLKDEFLTLANSKYILLELPESGVPKNLINYIHELLLREYLVIIAHPERYAYFQEDVNKLIPFLKMGVYFQGNIGSLFNYYGKDAKKSIKLMIKHNMIHFLASDCHKETDPNYEYYSKLNKKLNKDKILELTHTNPKLILEDEIIIPKKYKKCKYGLKNVIAKFKIK